jgi:hypothetical protein
MLKPILAGATAILIAGSSLAYAQERPAKADATQSDSVRDRAPRRFSAEDARAFTDARIASLKAGLNLTPEQEKNWPALETAIRDISKARIERMQQRREARRDGERRRDPVQRMREQADQLTQRAADLKKLADASEPLYKSLDEAQQRRMSVLTRQALGEGGRSGPRGSRWHHRRG